MKTEFPLLSQAQHRYARVLDWVTRLGFVLLVAAFAAYLLGLLPAHVPFERLPALWVQPVDAYLRESATPVGWGWVVLAAKGEFASLGGIVLLVGCSFLCLAAILPLYARRGEAIYFVLCLLELTVMALAASGIFIIGH
ncbi:MAG: hypothetical protein IPO58_22070 [Betaproteobacteria bacterium]|nr:hypothetical protein [Betaproteobacteria bacterium]